MFFRHKSKLTGPTANHSEVLVTHTPHHTTPQHTQHSTAQHSTAQNTNAGAGAGAGADAVQCRAGHGKEVLHCIA